jgi:two-component system, LytTR family, response regulator
MLKAIIIDDEQKSSEVLEKLSTSFIKGLSVVATANSVTKGANAIRKHNPDLVFLDIEMPRRDGFELFDEFKPVNFEVIFITAHEHYAIKAFHTSAIDYLLKPVDIDLLQESVDRVTEKRSNDKVNKNIDVLLHNLKSSQDQQIALATSDGLIFVKINDIIYLRGDGAYTYFFLKDGKRIIVSKNLKEYENLLPDELFFRVHKSFLIHLNQMKKYHRGEGGYVVMSNGDSVDVSKRRKEGFLSALSRI